MGYPIFIVGLAAAVSLVSFRFHYPATLKKMSVLWVFNFAVDLAGNIIKSLGFINLWLYNILFCIMFMGIAYLYREPIQSKHIRAGIRWFHILFPVLIVADTIFMGIKELLSVAIVVGSVFIIFLAAAYFRQLYLSEETEPITRDPWFWFSFGFLVHFGGTTPFLGMLNYLSKLHPGLTGFYYYHFCNNFTVIMNLLIIAGFLCMRKYQKSR